MEKNHFIVLKLRKKIILSLLSILILVILTFPFYRNITCMFLDDFLCNTIVIDAGHGGIDPGANDNNLLEKDINLDIALKLKKHLDSEFVNVIMTRNKDVSLENKSPLNSSRYKKDLHARKYIIETNKTDAFVSIHANSNPIDLNSKGIMIFYNKHSVQSKLLATQIATFIDIIIYKDFLNTNYNTQVLPQDYYILRKTSSPGVLIEVGFISNAKDKKLLQSDEYKEKIALSISCGLIEFFKKINPDKIKIITS